MEFRITYKKSVFKDLTNLPRKEVQKILTKTETELSKNAYQYPALKGEFKGLRRLRVGDYRIIYAVVEDEVIILRVYHRKEAYR